MYILVGKSINPDGYSVNRWIVGYSDVKRDLNIRAKRIRDRLASFKPFFKIEEHRLIKANLSYNDTIKIKQILNEENLDNKCDFTTGFGIDYVIIKLEEIKERI